jgi:hypothetical protein
MRTPPVVAAHTSSCTGVRHLIRTRKWNGDHPCITLLGVPASALGPVLGASPAAALPSEEVESFLDEPCVELEDAAVAGVGVGHQLTVRQAAGQVG